MIKDLKNRGFEREFVFKTARSSGPGGQNVNKVSSKVELRFNIPQSSVLSADEKEKLLLFYEKRLSRDGELRIVSSVSVSQYRNKEAVIDRFYVLLEKGLKILPERLPTKPSDSVKEKHKKEKILKSIKKTLRQPPEL